MDRSFGGEFEIIAGGLSDAGGFMITSNANPPDFALGLSAYIPERTFYAQYNWDYYRKVMNEYWRLLP